MIQYGRQDIQQEDIDAVVDVLRSDFLTDGPKVPQFEQSIIDYCHSNYAVAVNSATSALHIACLALDLTNTGLVWTSPISFVASANCAIYCGAAVNFVDIDAETYNISPQRLREKLENASANNEQLPDIVITVHLSGQVCEMEEIKSLSRQYGFAIIEDASHALGSIYKDSQIGSCKYSDITIFSFHPVKIMTTAEGGIATTNRSELATAMKLLRSHGVTRDAELMSEPSHGPWYYQQVMLGYNYRMSDISAALGISQLKRLSSFVTKRNSIAERYNNELKELPLRLPHQIEDSYSASHIYIIRLELGNLKSTHQEVFERLREKGIGVNLHYIPIHLQPYYQKLGFSLGDYPEAEKYYSEAITIPLHPQLTDNQIDIIIEELKNCLV